MGSSAQSPQAGLDPIEELVRIVGESGATDPRARVQDFLSRRPRAAPTARSLIIEQKSELGVSLAR